MTAVMLEKEDLMAPEWLSRERILPAGVMAFMLVSFLALSLHFDDRWWAAHHGHACAVATGPASLSPMKTEKNADARTPVSHPKMPRIVSRSSPENNGRRAARLRWEIAPSREWNGIEATLESPKPTVPPPVSAKNPKRPLRALSIEEMKLVFREIREAEENSRRQAMAADPTYGRRFATVMQRNLESYRSAIQDAHNLSPEQLSAIYRHMIEGHRAQHAAPPYLTNILP